MEIMFVIAAVIIIFVAGIFFYIAGTQNYEKAMALLSENRTKEAVYYLEKHIKSRPNDLKAIWILAGIYAEQNNFLKAVTLYKKIIQLPQKQDEVFEKDYKVESLKQIAKCYTHMQKYEEALNYYGEALLKNNKDEMIYYSRGKIYLIMEKYDKALMDFQKAVGIKRNLYKGFFFAGVCSMKLKKFEDAKSYLLKSTEINKNYHPAYYLLAKMHYKDNETDKALSLIKKVVDDSDSELKYKSILVYAKSLIAKGEYFTALNILRENQKNVKDKYKHLYLKYLYYSGVAHTKSGNDSSARINFRQAYKINSDYKNIKKFLEGDYLFMSDSQIKDKIFSMGPSKLEELFKEIVRGLGFELLQMVRSEKDDYTGIGVKSYEIQTNRTLITFKRWRNMAAEIPISEFYQMMVEHGTLHGIFVLTNEFTSSAYKEAKASKIRLINFSEFCGILRKV